MSTPIKPVTGITADTYNRLVYDSGVVYADFGETGERIVGATRGGNQFVIEPTFREMLADGAPGAVKGSQRMTRVDVKLTVNFLELTTANIKLFLPGSESVVDGNTEKITRKCQISAGDYLKNLTLVLAKNGTDELFAIKLLNPLCTNGLDFTGAEDDETVIAAEFLAHFDPAALDIEPWEIFNPSEVPVVLYNLAYTAGTNGSIIGDTLQSVVAGADGTAVYASPDPLYEFTQWSDLSTDNPRTDLAVGSDITQTATFTLI